MSPRHPGARGGEGIGARDKKKKTTQTTTSSAWNPQQDDATVLICFTIYLGCACVPSGFVARGATCHAGVGTCAPASAETAAEVAAAKSATDHPWLVAFIGSLRSIALVLCFLLLGGCWLQAICFSVYPPRGNFVDINLDDGTTQRVRGGLC